MTKEVKCIDIVFENCEVVRINKQYIGAFYMSNIRTDIYRIACNSISSKQRCEELFLEISSKANILEDNISGFDETLPFNRLLNYQDITHIDVIYEDDTNEYISVDWGGDSDYTNENQTSKINEYTGDLYIVISKKTNVNKYFEESLNQTSAWYWSMYED